MAGGITAPLGFRAAGLHVGIKKPGIPDLALVVSDVDGPVAGVFTRNRVAAAPVVLDQARLRRGRGRAVVVNSGNANACTGARGLRDAETMSRLAAQALGLEPESVLVGSTGVIGQYLPMDVIRVGIPALAARLSRRGGGMAAKAIMTTDLKPKEYAVQGRIGGKLVTVGGMAKGAGMIHPNMATMLAYLSTDVRISRPALQRALREAVEASFNAISIDGDTSTNDTVLCFANGLAGNAPLVPASPGFLTFRRLLTDVCRELAMQILRDGEGVTKVLAIHVTGARTVAEARRVGETVATSALVKTALFGEDANWGRIMAAVGRSGVRLDQAKIGLSFDGVPIVRNGMSLGPQAERRIEPIVRRKEFGIDISLGMGTASACRWTTDLSYDYVKINASYRT